MIETLIFKHYDRKRKVILKCDSSNWCLSEILSQYDDEKILHSMIFYSKKMILAKCNYEIYDKKLLIIIRCLKHWRFELKEIDELVEIYIDHKDLKIFMIIKKLISRQVRWVEILTNYNIRIQYQSSAKNVKVDALTRMLEYRSNENDERQKYRKQMLLFSIKFQLCSIDTIDDLYDRVLQINKKNTNCFLYREILKAKQVNVEEESFQECIVKDETLYKHENFWVSKIMNLLLKIVRDAHDQLFNAHSNINRIEKLIKRYYYWLNMRQIIKRYIRNCHNCHRVKVTHDECNDRLKSLLIFNQRWVNIFMNFIVNLLDSKSHNAICIIIDRLIKKRCSEIEWRF